MGAVHVTVADVSDTTTLESVGGSETPNGVTADAADAAPKFCVNSIEATLLAMVTLYCTPRSGLVPSSNTSMTIPTEGEVHD